MTTLLLLFACSSEEPATQPSIRRRAPDVPEVEAGVRVFAVDQPQDCPSPLFGGKGPDREDRWVPPSLRTWCVERGATAPIPAEQANHVVLGLAGTADDLSAHDAKAALAAIGRVYAPVGAARARLAIVDTSPTFGTPLGNGATFGSFDRDTTSQHGVTLANLAATLLCAQGPANDSGGPGCAADIYTRLAMPATNAIPVDGGLDLKPDMRRGGAFGTILDLALAIEAETAKAIRDTGSAQALVLSISAGFARRWAHPTGDVNVWGNDTLALYGAIEYARCNGALVIAAEGNAERKEAPGEVLLPAAWGSPGVERPTTTGCAAHMAPDVVAWDGQGPLVYPVGGVDGANRRLDTALPTGSSIRAFGASTSAPYTEQTSPPRSPEEPYSTSIAGSSVATLVVSAAAAARWAAGRDACADTGTATAGATTNPGTTTPYPASEVMADVVAGCSGPATVLGDVLDPAAPPRVVRADSALKPCGTSPTAICGMTADAAPPLALAPGPATSLACVATTNLRNACPTTLATPFDVYACGVDAGGCSDPVYAAIDCPEAEPMSGVTHPWVLPQPPPPYCPYCYFDSRRDELYIKDAPVAPDNQKPTAPASLVLRSGGRDYVYGGFEVSRLGEHRFLLVGTVDAIEGARIIVYNDTFQASAPVRIMQ